VRFEIPRDATAGYVNNQRETFGFQFDGILTPDAGQDEVFERVAKRPVLGALDGFNGTVFAYGQTGSGKTFTIAGGVDRYADRGIVPRAVSELFSEMRRRSETCAYEVSVSYVEVYNDQAYDLLCDTGVAAGETAWSSAGPSGGSGSGVAAVKTTGAAGKPGDSDFLPKVTLLEDDEGVMHLRNCSTHRASCEEDALNLLFVGDINRAVAETPMNVASSRSHCVFTVVVDRREVGSEVVRRGKLHLVDLAGSERVAKTGLSETFTLREAKHINLSLHALEKVVVALQEKDPHVPYRDSTMTMLLKDSLGGNCRTAMVATVNPEVDHVFESISTCRFALRIASVTNQLMVNEETDPKLVVKRLRKENKALREEVRMLRGEDEESRESLTASEMSRLKTEIEKFCAVEDPSSANDREDALDLGASMLKIRAAIAVFRDLVVEARLRKKGPQNGPRWTSDGGGPHGRPSSGEARDTLGRETARLTATVRQRDEEIRVLVAMLDKQGRLAVPMRQSDETANETETEPKPESLGPSKPSTPDGFDALPPSYRSNHAPSHLSKHRVFPDRASAFEHFKRESESLPAMEANKKTLREKYILAKSYGEAVNVSRMEIGSLKSKLETCRVKRAYFLDTPNATASHDEHQSEGSFELEERALLTNLETEKKTYKTNFDALRDLKKEIERVQSLLERIGRRMTREFEVWFTGNAYGDASFAQPGDGRDGTVIPSGDSSGDGSGDAGTMRRTSSPSPPAPTGNAQADADIAAFYAARQKLLRPNLESTRDSKRRSRSSDT